MKTDELGTYDENEIPSNLKLPLKLDRSNEAFVSEDGQIIARYSFSSELGQRVSACRRADFVVRLANGEIIVSVGKVLRKIAEQWQDGQMVSVFVPVGVLTEEELKNLSKIIIEDDPVKMREEFSSNGLSDIAKKEIGKTEMRKLQRYLNRVKTYTNKLNKKYGEQKND